MSTRKSRVPRHLVVLGAVAVLAAVVWMALRFGNPFPPRAIAMATGPEGSASGEFGARYREYFQRRGVELRLIPTAGGVENLRRLNDPRSEVSVAIVECGLTSREASPDLVSLGMVTLEPLWVFLRRPPQDTGRPQGTRSPQDTEAHVSQRLAGKRLSIEPEGSATRVLARQLLALNGVDESSLELRGLTPEQSAAALLRGEIDGAILLTSWQSPAVRTLLVADGIVLERHARVDAYVALSSNLSKVVLPAGVADLARNIPPTDVPMLAVEASLVVRKDLHPALQYLLLEAAAEIHGGPQVFYRAGRFPSPEVVDLPLSYQAGEFYKSGRPFVYRYLPIWLAGLAERLMILLIPLFVVVLPIVHFLPSGVAFVINRRIFSLYGELKILELELERAGPGDIQGLGAALDTLSQRANRLRVPLGYAQRLFILKSHIALAQAEIEKRRRSGA